jgi:hypothetical protein
MATKTWGTRALAATVALGLVLTIGTNTAGPSPTPPQHPPSRGDLRLSSGIGSPSRAPDARVGRDAAEGQMSYECGVGGVRMPAWRRCSMTWSALSAAVTAPDASRWISGLSGSS